MLVLVVLAVLTLAGLDLALRSRRHSNRPCFVALTSGIALLLFSLFGLLWGIASIGVVGALIAFAALPIKVVTKSPQRLDGRRFTD